MTTIKKDHGDNKVLKERNPEKNFNETRFMADIVLFFCERSLDEIRTAKRNEEMTAVCNLYSMIKLMELREIAGFNCNFGLIDRYREIILKKTRDSLHMMGVQTSGTYQFNPYMVCTFMAACVDMDAVFFRHRQRERESGRHLWRGGKFRLSGAPHENACRDRGALHNHPYL